MLRSRFKANGNDYRPIKWPPPGPYWCSGYDSEDNSILIAYSETKQQIKEFWPEAFDIESEEQEISFTERFPKPDWYEEPQQ